MASFTVGFTLWNCILVIWIMGLCMLILVVLITVSIISIAVLCMVWIFHMCFWIYLIHYISRISYSLPQHRNLFSPTKLTSFLNICTLSLIFCTISSKLVLTLNDKFLIATMFLISCIVYLKLRCMFWSYGFYLTVLFVYIVFDSYNKDY